MLYGKPGKKQEKKNVESSIHQTSRFPRPGPSDCFALVDSADLAAVGHKFFAPCYILPAPKIMAYKKVATRTSDCTQFGVARLENLYRFPFSSIFGWSFGELRLQILGTGPAPWLAEAIAHGVAGEEARRPGRYGLASLI